MKRPSQISIMFVLLFAFCLQSVNACTVEVLSLRKEFRKANAVFIGKIIDVNDVPISEAEKQKVIPQDWRNETLFSKVMVEIKQKWKGNLKKTQEFWGVVFGSCRCRQPDNYKLGKEYLIFAQTNNFIAFCDSNEISYDSTKDDIKRLDNFGFRLWSRIYPF